MCACVCCTVDFMFIRGEYVCMYVLHSRFHVYKGRVCVHVCVAQWISCL